MFVKLCGMRLEQDLEWASWADAVGFIVMTPNSHRNLELDRAAELMEGVADQLRVAVTTEEDPDRLLELLQALPRCALQLHRQLSPTKILAYRDLFNSRGLHPRQFWTVMQVPVDEADPHLAPKLKALGGASALARPHRVVLDTKGPELGGTGRTHNWKVSSELVQVGLDYEIPTLLAGGLGPDNIVEAIREVSPEGIDISGGIEGKDGFKSREKILNLRELLGRSPLV